MPVVDITILRTEKLNRLAAAIREAGDKGLQRKLDKAMRKIAAPMRQSARNGALAILPKRGGLNERVAGSSFSVRFRATSSGVSFQVVGVSRRRDQLSRMDAPGFVRHPDYPGDKPRSEWTWSGQSITPGWFTKPLTLDAAKNGGEIDHAISELAQELEAEGG